jgi:hypothetical protein
VRSALATRADNERAAHEKGPEEMEQSQGEREAPDVRRPVGSARALDRLDDAVDGSSHAKARVLSQPGADGATHSPGVASGYDCRAIDTAG